MKIEKIKANLEIKILNFIRKELSEFRFETGYSISHIDINFYDITRPDDRDRQYTTTNVSCDFYRGLG